MLYTFRVSLRATGEFEVKLALRRALFYAHFIRVCFSVSLFYRVSFSIMAVDPSAMLNATGVEPRLPRFMTGLPELRIRSGPVAG